MLLNFFYLTDFGYTNLTHKHGRRISQFNNHWNKKPEICLNAVVTRIIFDQENSKRAVGVEFIKNDQVHRVINLVTKSNEIIIIII